MNHAEYAIMAQVEDTHWWYRSLRGIIRQHWRRYITEKDPIVLDIGCGTGANMAFLREEATVLGLDISEEALHFSKARDLPHLSQGNAMSLPIKDASVDLCYSMDVLYHRAIDNKLLPLQEAYRVLKPGGYLFINVPAYAWLASSHDRAIHTDHRFVRSEIRSLLVEAGFEATRLSYWNMFLFPAVALVRILRKHDESTDSDLSGYRSTLATWFFEHILRLEGLLMRLSPLPFGVSIFAVGRKPS